MSNLLTPIEASQSEMDPRMREPKATAMTDDNFDKLWATFKRSLVEARENRRDGTPRIRMKDGHVFVESGEDNEGGLMIFRDGGNKAIVYPTRQEFEELAAHCLLAAEEMKPETNYKPNNP